MGVAKNSKSTRPPRGSYRRKPWRERILKHIAAGETIATAANLCGIHPRTVYLAVDTDADFRDAYNNAMRESLDHLEREARNRAYHGVDEPVIYQGKLCFVLQDDKGTQLPIELLEKLPVGKDGKPAIPKGWFIKPLTIRKPSDGLMTLLLRARRPEVFREIVKHTSDGSFKEEQIVLVHTPPPGEENVP